jgi:DNA-directed RNA polymerase subunit RPC12/RpoP
MAGRLINCAACNRSVRNTDLIVIGGKAFCGRCLKRIHIKGRGISGWYYMHLKKRIFVEYWDGHDRVVEEFGMDELVVGRRTQRQMEQEEERYA